ncbi:lipid IV(A) 4-amino-4-deoxy-L-arabinosyltransferase [Thorsellia anophelis]|uniref:4-amino-4-deoxy-L-arabinose transferase n=1 Tax=Thorsellia anophelis DSM 18579 TaxID=1123402 RepID=A0A1I0BNA1_9GAMM|nr:lipid IV(A) 4-amino-4-deoxy-L-arabinosyltransferase [Thorsellia anophelis]SET08430.1 4-amino-4-deoxy-L-arabinose transferase [Thorsellia anophelis DSM 18579]
MKIINHYFTLLISGIFFIIYIVPLNNRLLWQPDEVRYAAISKEMIDSGNWIVPHLLGLRYFEKPIAGYWLNAISQLIFGHSNFAVRFASVFSTMVTAFFIYKITLILLKSKQTAQYAVLIFLTSFLVFAVGTYSVLDPMLMMWITGAIYVYTKINQDAFNPIRAPHITTIIKSSRFTSIIGYGLIGFFCAMAVLTKGFLGVVIPVIILLPTSILIGQIYRDLRYCLITIFTLIAFCLPWALAIHAREPDYWHYFFWIEHIQRFAHDNAQHKAPFWYYMPIILLASLPWLGFLIQACFHCITNRNKPTSYWLLINWLWIPFIFFSIAKGKLLTYILVCMPALAITIAAYISYLIHKKNTIKALDTIGKFRLSELNKISPFTLNAIINISFGVLGIILLMLMISGFIPSLNLFSKHEFSKVGIGIIIFFSWSCFGGLTLLNKHRYWYLAAGCPLLLSLLFGFTVPDKIVDSKQPQSFIQDHLPLLTDSTVIVSDSIGVATALGYELSNPEIFLLNEKGELAYGLGYPDSQYRFIPQENLNNWLNEKRKHGSVAIVRLKKSNSLVQPSLPPASFVSEEHRFSLYWYDPF